MRRNTILFLAVMTGTSPAVAQENVFGEIGASYGYGDIEDVDANVDTFQAYGAGAFVSAAGLGIQLGGAYDTVSVDNLGDIESYTIDGHIYGDFGSAKAGVFAGLTRVGELEIFGVGGFDIDEDVLSYGVEGQSRVGSFTYHGYAGVADVQGPEFLETTLYGIGADFDVSPALQLTANFDGAELSADGIEEELNLSTVSLGVDYYVNSQKAPVRLSATVGRDMAEFDGFDADGLSIGVGAAVLFGNQPNSNREKLFDSTGLPF
ncbi:hypothetical protein [Palleronia abyssalis]|uniref:Outer membrane protein beta-barrel domain-containing protein n=1 Tax=Palleronia abyssalis TaxID=1501240 RepID=A0A2R8BZ76_9RHOB|nr:hypothetical protein [Palleronia abyssalis]SPJ25477.1 hypothetical protein PAA8504_03328 [Palleronia abyssalis]